MIGIAALAGCVRPEPPPVRVYGPPTPAAPTQEARRTPDVGAPTTRPAPAQQPIGPSTIVVEPGDTVHSLSRKHGVTLRDLIEANGLAPPFTLTPGQRLSLPSVDLHKVREGETIYGIARHYGIDARELVRINAIPPPYRIQAGRTLKLPQRLPSQLASNASTVPTSAPPPPAATPGAHSSISVAPRAAVKLPDELPDPEPDQASLAAPVPDATPSRGGGDFLWPVKGKVVARFGSQGGGLHNDGINIAAPHGTPVHAAENGVVVYAGNELSGFGNLLILRHADGWMTAYGHIDAMRVRRGETVRRGQVIATVGQTGGVNAPQLHFEIRRGSTPVDPSRFLAGGSTASFNSSGAVRDGRRGPG